MLYDPKWQPPETTTEEWRTVVGKAADLIEKVGWVRGTYCREEEVVERKWGFLKKTRTQVVGYCIVGALREITGGENARPHSRYWPIADRIEKEMGINSVVNWNDSQAQSKEEVVAKLREIANAV